MVPVRPPSGVAAAQADGGKALPTERPTAVADGKADGGKALPTERPTAVADGQADGGKALPTERPTAVADGKADGGKALPTERPTAAADGKADGGKALPTERPTAVADGKADGRCRRKGRRRRAAPPQRRSICREAQPGRIRPHRRTHECARTHARTGRDGTGRTLTHGMDADRRNVTNGARYVPRARTHAPVSMHVGVRRRDTRAITRPRGACVNGLT